jgi:hypothetical protein
MVRRKKYIETNKETNFKKWLKILCSPGFIMEFLILVIHPLPYIEYEYTFKILNMLGSKDQLVDVNYMLGDFLFAYMFLRVYFLLRTVSNFSYYSNLNSKKICSKYGFESNTSFVLKASILKHPGLTILLVSITSIMWLSYLLRIFER